MPPKQVPMIFQRDQRQPAYGRPSATEKTGSKSFPVPLVEQIARTISSLESTDISQPSTCESVQGGGPTRRAFFPGSSHVIIDAIGFEFDLAGRTLRIFPTQFQAALVSQEDAGPDTRWKYSPGHKSRQRVNRPADTGPP